MLASTASPGNSKWLASIRENGIIPIRDQQLGISVSLVYGLIASRRLRHERFGLGRGTIRIPAEAIEEYRRNCTVTQEKQETKATHSKQRIKLQHLRV